MAGIGEDHLGAGVQEREFAEAMLERRVVETRPL